MSAVTRTAEARMRLVRALVRSKSTAAAAAGKPIAHIYPNSETPVKALDPCDAVSMINCSASTRRHEKRKAADSRAALTKTRKSHPLR